MSTTIDDLWGDFWLWTQTHPAGAYLFRGQADDSPIVPKIGRAGYSYDRINEDLLFKAFERAARPFLDSVVVDPFELLALAQHHGAPTRLADWTTTPLVAAWFAVSSYPENKDAQIYALDLFRDDLDRIESDGKTLSGSRVEHPLSPKKGVFLVETAQVSSRITTQRGIFTLHGEPTVALPVPAAETFAIPAALRKEFQSRLMDVGIDAAHIYPDIDGLCRSLDWRLKNGKPLSAFG